MEEVRGLTTDLIESQIKILDSDRIMWREKYENLRKEAFALRAALEAADEYIRVMKSFNSMRTEACYNYYAKKKKLEEVRG